MSMIFGLFFSIHLFQNITIVLALLAYEASNRLVTIVEILIFFTGRRRNHFSVVSLSRII
jgi:hypothetical protein